MLRVLGCLGCLGVEHPYGCKGASVSIKPEGGKLREEAK